MLLADGTFRSPSAGKGSSRQKSSARRATHSPTRQLTSWNPRKEALNLELVTHQSRAIFVATLNAALRHLGMVGATVHCKDDDPESCAEDIAAVLFQGYGKVPVGLIGLNPAIAEQLVDTFGPSHVHITDLNSEDIGRKRFGVEIWDGDDRTDDLVAISDVVLVTGTTIVNGTFDRIWKRIRSLRKDFLLYGSRPQA